jgi:pSer/pThr/pTyr-binding forkhead associated (FHA) protein
MEAQINLTVIDGDGWQKEFRLPRSIAHIGSDPRNEIVLARAGNQGVAPRHAQLIALPGGYRLVNLGGEVAQVGASGEQAVAPHAYVNLAEGERVRIGNYTLILGTSSGAAFGNVAVSATGVSDSNTAETIGLRLYLPRSELDPSHPINGALTVTNLGSQPAAQFKLEVEGLDADCYSLGPGPVLFPNAEKEVLFRLAHTRKPRPAAGEYRFTVRVTAPSAYPGQAAVVSQVLRILPYYAHKASLAIPD